MIITKRYEVRCLVMSKDGFVKDFYESFKDKEKAQQFYENLPSDSLKVLLLCEKTVKQTVIESNYISKEI